MQTATAATVVHHPRFERVEDAVRCFRLYDANVRKFLLGRNFVHRRNALMGALIEARWSKIGTCIEVIDVSRARMIGQYRRRVNDIHFMGE